MSKIERHSSSRLEQLMANRDPIEREIASIRVAMAVRIADAIEAKNMSKVVFASLMDKHPSEITKWLSGRHNFTLDTLSAIQAKLGIQLISTEDKKEESTQTIVAAFAFVPSNQKYSNNYWQEPLNHGNGTKVLLINADKASYVS